MQGLGPDTFTDSYPLKHEGNHASLYFLCCGPLKLEGHNKHFSIFRARTSGSLNPDYWGCDGSLSPSTREGREARCVLPPSPRTLQEFQPSQT